MLQLQRFVCGYMLWTYNASISSYSSKLPQIKSLRYGRLSCRMFTPSSKKQVLHCKQSQLNWSTLPLSCKMLKLL